MNRIFVLSSTKQPLMPCHPARARELLRKGKAAVYRMQPFTIILKSRTDGVVQDIAFKTDPGSKTTGIVLVAGFEKHGSTVIWAANLSHRGAAIHTNLDSRRSLRRGRRGRKTRYREARFNNRTRQANCGGKWLAPSIKSRVDNVAIWYGRLNRLAPISEAHIETVRFDMQKMANPEISGVEYQQGTLAGYELREYLLEKFERTCAYCGKKDVPLQIEHIQPKALGGSDRASNLTVACRPCNEKKAAQPVEKFLVGKPDLLKKIKAQAKAPLRDAAAVNSARYALGNEIKAWGLPTSFWSGGRTKLNRVTQGYAKDHWIDAACVGETGAAVVIPPGLVPLQIKATGRGTHQTVKTDKFGFPRGGAGRCKRVFGFQTGDLVRLSQPSGKYAGDHIGRLAGIRATGYFDIRSGDAKITARHQNFTLLQRSDGYEYSNVSGNVKGRRAG
ncbi:5-methylcytosine-specific restriction enzyme A [Gammaproteobacteria bacterium]